MRILVVSDIHGNAAALEAVLAEPHDALVCLGDVVGYGPEPGACWRLIQPEAEVRLKGNHDHALATGAPPGCRPSFERLAELTASFGLVQLSPAERAALGKAPAAAIRELDGVRCLLVHATPSDPLYRYLGPESAEWEREVGDVEAGLVFVGHTHVQFRRTVAGRTIINPGSVGQPKDGDPRAAYVLLEDGAVHLRRADYPVERTVSRLEASGLDRTATARLATLLRTGRPG